MAESSAVSMFRHSSLPLSRDIYHLIYPKLARRELVRLLKTCHTLFYWTVPYLWKHVDIDSLLRLLPGCSWNHNQNGEGQVCSNYRLYERTV
jgi:hypothetical protein